MSHTKALTSVLIDTVQVEGNIGIAIFSPKEKFFKPGLDNLQDAKHSDILTHCL